MTIRRPWYLYFLLVFFPFVLFAPIILRGQALFWGTPLTQFIPWWTSAWEMIARGVLPLWNSEIGMGAPLIANYQSALFYPPTWIYFILFHFGDVPAMAWGQAIMVVFHLSWAAFGMALLSRHLGVSKFGQIVGGLAFGLSGYLVSRAGFLSINSAVAWMPWIILGITKLVESLSGEKFFRNSSNPTRSKNNKFDILVAFMLLVLCIAMQLLSGHAQTTWYTLILGASWLVFFGLIFTINERKNKIDAETPISDQGGGENLVTYLVKDKSNGKFNVKPFILIMLVFGIALILAVGLAAIQLIPTAEYLMQSQRSAAVDYDFAMSYSFWPWRFLTLITPDLYGSPVSGDYWGYANYWEDAIYIGLLPFIFALITLIRKGANTNMNVGIRPAFVGFLFGIILVSFLLALGQNTPLFPWLYENVPTFDMFQAPTRISILAVFSLTLLSGFGVDSWRHPGARGLYWLRLGVVAALAITIGAIAAFFISRSFAWDIKPSFIKATAILGISGTGLVFLAMKAPHPTKEIEINRKWGKWEWAVVLWVAADLLVAGWGLNPAVDLGVYADPSPSAEEINGMLNNGRLFLPNEDEEKLKFDRFLRFDTFQPFDEGEDWKSLRTAMLPNVAILDGIPSANNFDPLLPARFVNWLETLEKVNSVTMEQMLMLMGVTVVESIDSGSTSGVKFESRAAYPRFRWVPCSIDAESGEKALQMIKKSQVDLQREVILEQVSQKAGYICDPTHKAEVRILSIQEDKVELQVNSPSPGYLLMADVWYPGWRAWTGGQEIPILRANYLFRAVAIPAGEQKVTIAYRSLIFYLGALISGIFWAGILVFSVFWIIKDRHGN
jgi:hypothetical protein